MNVLHGDINLVIDGTQIKDLNNIEVLKVCGQLGLVNEHLTERRVLTVGGKDPLQGNEFFKT